MNIFQLVLKNMRQRSLSTCLTLMSVLLGVALAIGIMILRREGAALFAQTDFGYEVLLGPSKGSPLQLVLNTVYHIDESPGLVPYSVFEDVSRKTPAPPGRADYRQFVKFAVPFMVGDSYEGRKIIGTSPQMFGVDDAGIPIADQPNADGQMVSQKFQYRKGKSFEIAQGRVFAPRKFEAVVGADVASVLHVHVYDPSKSEEENLADGGAFRATHGTPGPNAKPDIHKPRWHVVGILKPTGTANDRALFVPFISLYAIADHESGMIDQALMRAKIDPSRIPPNRLDDVLQQLGVDPKRIPESVRRKFKMNAKPTPTTSAATEDVNDLMKDAAVAPTTTPSTAATSADGEDPDVYHLDAQGNIVPDLPQDEWTLNAILVKARGGDFGGYATTTLLYNFKLIDDRASAVNPASIMREFFDTFLKGSANVLLAISVLVTVVAGASITTTIYNSVSARLREIAILRALGATRGKILSIICLEATLIGLVGGILGLLVGHGLTLIASGYLKQTVGEDIDWLTVGLWEWIYLLLVVVLSLLAGLVPAMKAYRTPVATNLVAG